MVEKINGVGEGILSSTKEFFFPNGGMPHGYCYLWDAKLVYAHLIPDLLIFASYTTIAITLAVFIRRAKKDIPFHGIFIAFASFIVLCGLTHLMGAYTIYRPAFWLDAAIKIATAISSVATAVWLPFVVPIVLKTARQAKEYVDMKVAHERLRANRKHSHLLSAIKDGFITLDSEWRILYLNPAAEEITGSTIDSVGGVVIWDAWPYLKGTVREEEYRKTMETREPTRFQAPRMNMTTGFEIWTDSSVYPDEETGGINIFVRDITPVKQAMHDLERANKAKTDFLAVMSHELRTPLTAVVAFGELLAEGVYGDLNHDQADSIHRIRNAGTHLVSMIDQILNFSAIEEGRIVMRPETVNVCKLVNEVELLMSPLCRDKNLEMTVWCERRNPFIITDPQKLKQILINLLSNAIKFTDNGSISLTVEKVNNHFIKMQVSDTGIGIPEQHREKIFEKFWQVQQGLTRTAGGAGIGLAITKRFTELLGGKITVESTVKTNDESKAHGSTFTVTLPVNMPTSTL
jgi:PAS domain S-box-containing protein